MAIIETEQSREVRLTQIIRGPFVFRYASYRKSEDAKLGLKSEDYIVSELTGSRALFTLCDGVGSSFYGNMGAQILGETVFQWLKTVSISEVLKTNESSSEWLKLLNQSLHRELNSKTQFATEIIYKKEFPESDLTSLAQIMQRDNFGTQSNLACGLVYPKCHELPNGLIILFWVGNARIRIFNKDQDMTSALHWGENPDQLKEVWSSKDGVVGKLYSHLTDFANVSSIMAYSDGLEEVEDHITPGMSGINLETLVNQAQSLKDDDISYLELFVQEDWFEEDTSDIANTIRDQLSSSVGSKYEEIKKKLSSVNQENKVLLKKLRLNKIISISLLSLLLPVLAIGVFSGFFIQGYIVKFPSPSPTSLLISASNTASPTITSTHIQPSQTSWATQLIPTPSLLFETFSTPSINTVTVADTPAAPVPTLTSPSAITQITDLPSTPTIVQPTP